jgi:hypothetical protein
MGQMTMEIIAIVLGIFALAMTAGYYRTTKKLNAVSLGFTQLYKDYVAMHDLLRSNSNPNNLRDDDVHKENFIKFLSESRDWAFNYIEDVQSVLKKFISEVQPQIDYYNEYGIVVDGIIPPHDFALKKISKELDDLKKLLPEDIDDRR